MTHNHNLNIIKSINFLYTENRKSLMEGKIASQKLKAINDQIDSAMDQGLPVSHLEE